ncbi:MAG TPA: MBL fold metallo-hydrolase, partial [Candidatus Acetothermia bacterium]|nr:MBL fold metallo-hydrolase [Candidatus Acetothermia bacterium]
MQLVILYDNVARPPLREGWGFSALIELQDRKILFDAGADRLLLE